MFNSCHWSKNNSSRHGGCTIHLSAGLNGSSHEGWMLPCKWTAVGDEVFHTASGYWLCQSPPLFFFHHSNKRHTVRSKTHTSVFFAEKKKNPSEKWEMHKFVCLDGQMYFTRSYKDGQISSYCRLYHKDYKCEVWWNYRTLNGLLRW